MERPDRSGVAVSGNQDGLVRSLGFHSLNHGRGHVGVTRALDGDHGANGLVRHQVAVAFDYIAPHGGDDFGGVRFQQLQELQPVSGQAVQALAGDVADRVLRHIAGQDGKIV